MALANPDRFYASFIARRVFLELYRRKVEAPIPEKLEQEWWNCVGESLNFKVTKPITNQTNEPVPILSKIIPFSWYQNDEIFSDYLDESLKHTGICFMMYIMASVRGHNEVKYVVDEVDKEMHKLGPVVKTLLNWLRFIYFNLTTQTAVTFTEFTEYLFQNNVINNWSEATIFGCYIGAIMGSTRLYADKSFIDLFNSIQRGENIDYPGLVNSFIQKSPKSVIPRVTYPMTESYTSQEITDKRNQVLTDIRKVVSDNFDAFDENVILRLLLSYDVYFFNNLLMATLTDKKLSLKITLDDRSVSSVGCMRFSQNDRILIINRSIILGTFRRGEQYHYSNGLKWNTRMGCLMSTIEHELVHILLNVWDCVQDSGSKIYSHHGFLFQQVAKAYFGHTDFYHAFDIDGASIKSKDDFVLGQVVGYLDDKKELSKYDGKIIKLNKRTTKLEVINDAGEKSIVKIPYGYIKIK